jgi:hypothetical protein
MIIMKCEYLGRQRPRLLARARRARARSKTTKLNQECIDTWEMCSSMRFLLCDGKD